jgi:arsenate reductase
MHPDSRAESTSAARDLRTVADPTRLEILRLILAAPDGRLGVTDLAERLSLTQPTVSHHLRVLEDDGLVIRAAEGRHRFTSVAPDRIAEVAGWLRVGSPTGAIEPAVLDRIVDDLAQRFAGVFSRETVAEYVRGSADLLADRPRAGGMHASMTAQFAAERLAATARSTRERSGEGPPEVLFVCVQNAGRSQLAAAILRFVAGDRVRVRTAGSEPTGSIHPLVLTALDEIGVPVGGEFPKPLTDEAVRAADVVITMGCGDACPIYPGIRYLDWELPDPATLGLDGIRAVRDDIDGRVRALLDELTGPVEALPKA